MLKLDFRVYFMPFLSKCKDGWQIELLRSPRSFSRSKNLVKSHSFVTKIYKKMVPHGMLIKTIDALVHMEGAPQSEQLFPVEKEYAPDVTALNRTGILTLLPKSESIGVIGINGKGYPKPT